MSAREELFRRVSGAFVDEGRANALLDAYRAEVLREAADEVAGGIHTWTGMGDQAQAANKVREQVAAKLRRMADAAERGEGQ